MLFIVPLLFVGCVQKSINVSDVDSEILKTDTIKVEKFRNNTSTPLAGKKVSAIIAAALRNRGFLISDKLEDEENNEKFIIKGSVNEWRYKTGIDGEPAVNFSLRIIRNKNKKIVFSGMGSISGDGYDSLGILAQEISDEILNKID